MKTNGFTPKVRSETEPYSTTPTQNSLQSFFQHLLLLHVLSVNIDVVNVGMNLVFRQQSLLSAEGAEPREHTASWS
jgi:hypothetical protein